MNLVFMGTPDFAVPTLEALIASGHQVTLVVTQPDRPGGRGYKLIPSPVKIVAADAGIDIEQPQRVAEIRTKLEHLQPDAVVVVAFGQKIPSWLLDLPTYGCINLHPSLLPKYRGAAPIQAAIANGDTVTGITSMLLDEGWDTGDILLQEQVPIKAGETGGQLHDRLMVLGAGLILDTLSELAAENISPRKQDDSLATYAPKLSKEAAKIDWHMPAVDIAAKVRALNPWPVAWTTHDGVTLKIWRAEADEKLLQAISEKPGMIQSITDDSFGVITGRGVLIVQEIQRPGGKPLSVQAFLNGYPLSSGTFLA